jgi:hypothetical protein
MAKKLLNQAQRTWIDRLKSGKTRKATDALTQGNGYCCLGVACRLAGIPKVEMKGHEDLEEFRQVVSSLNLRDDCGSFRTPVETGKQVFYSLATMNDGGWSHKKIGEYIEAHPDNVFV